MLVYPHTLQCLIRQFLNTALDLWFCLLSFETFLSYLFTLTVRYLEDDPLLLSKYTLYVKSSLLE